MKNPYKRQDHRQDFDEAVRLQQEGMDRWDCSKKLKELFPELTRGRRQSISAKVARLLK